jgi:chorismate mutase
MVFVRAARGAIAVDADTAESVLESTRKLLTGILERNQIGHDDLISILFTVTDDLRSVFPAEAARQLGMGDVPLLCAREIPVAGAMPSVVRVLLHFHSSRPLADVVHVYLDGAERLRDDLDAAT